MVTLRARAMEMEKTQDNRKTGVQGAQEEQLEYVTQILQQLRDLTNKVSGLDDKINTAVDAAWARKEEQEKEKYELEGRIPPEDADEYIRSAFETAIEGTDDPVAKEGFRWLAKAGGDDSGDGFGFFKPPSKADRIAMYTRAVADALKTGEHQKLSYYQRLCHIKKIDPQEIGLPEKYWT